MNTSASPSSQADTQAPHLKSTSQSTNQESATGSGAARIPKLDPDLEEIALHLANELNTCEQNALGWQLQAGLHLLEARECLPRGDWSSLFRSGSLPIGERSAQMLVRIVSNEVLRNPQHLCRLPRSIDALHVLAQLEANVLEQHITTGRIYPALTAKHARTLVRQHRGIFDAAKEEGTSS